MIPELLLATALAAPLDDAAADGRPIIILLNRGFETDRPLALWLEHAEGEARDRLNTVALVYATAGEVEAWTGAEVFRFDALVRIDGQDRSIQARAALRVPVPPQHQPRFPPKHPIWMNKLDNVVTAYQNAVIDYADKALQQLLDDVQTEATPADASVAVFGAARCRQDFCGISCDREEEMKPGHHYPFSSSGACGQGYIPLFTRDFLMRWPPEAP